MRYGGSSANGVPWSREYRSGARSRRAGLTVLANPWHSGTHAHASWSKGWEDENKRIVNTRALTKETQGEA